MRVQGGKITVIYDTTKPQPLDARMLVGKYEDLINPETWYAGGDSTKFAAFKGMIVAVNENSEYKGIYYLSTVTAPKQVITSTNYEAYQAAVTNGEDITPYFSMWTKLASANDVPTLQITIDGGEILADEISEEE